MTDPAPSIAPTVHQTPKLVWVSLAMLLLQVLVGSINLFFFEPIEMGVFLLAFTVALTLLALGFIALLAMGYGWVRHLYVVGTVLSLIPFLLSLPQSLHSLPMNGVWVLAVNLWFWAALALLYSSSARAWFREARLQRKRGL